MLEICKELKTVQTHKVEISVFEIRNSTVGLRYNNMFGQRLRHCYSGSYCYSRSLYLADIAFGQHWKYCYSGEYCYNGDCYSGALLYLIMHAVKKIFNWDFMAQKLYLQLPTVECRSCLSYCHMYHIRTTT